MKDGMEYRIESGCIVLRPKDVEPNDVVIVDYDYCIAVMDKAIEDSLEEQTE